MNMNSNSTPSRMRKTDMQMRNSLGIFFV